MNEQIIKEFFNNVDPEILYNEASIQFELGWYLRNKYPNYKIYLERNVSHLRLTNPLNEKFVKSEIDILIYESQKPIAVIELKAPINQRQVRPVTVFNWIRDIFFLEQLEKNGIKGYSIFVTDNKGYFEGKKENKGLLTDFRAKQICGTYKKHKRTKSRNETILLNNRYSFSWNNLNDKFFYFIVKPNKTGTNME